MTDTHSSIWTTYRQRAVAGRVHLLGCVDFDSAQELIDRLADETSEREQRSVTLLLCEHAPTVTIGRDGSCADLLVEPKEFVSRLMPVRRVRRSGGTLVHVPGQLAGYLIRQIPDGSAPADGRDAVRRALEAVQSAAADQRVTGFATRSAGPSAAADSGGGLSGLHCRCGWFAWAGVERRDGMELVSLYVNVNPDLILQRLVRSVPDGIRLASLSMERMKVVEMHRVRESLLRHLAEQFSFEEYSLFTGHPLLQRTRRKVCEYV